MESWLLCDEDWLTTSSPIHLCPPTHHNTDPNFIHDSSIPSFYNTMEDYENALMVSLHKEATYMPKPGYTQTLLQSSHFLLQVRIMAFQFFLQARFRLNMALDTIFGAINYFDRFISMNKCNVWTMGLVELLPIACLSISAKFNEVDIPQLQSFFGLLKMEDSNRLFQSRTIQEMELIVLKALEWRLTCVTPYSYSELLIKLLNSIQSHLHLTITSRVNELLLGVVLDPKFIEFRPSVIALSALRCTLEELLPSKSDAHLANLLTFIPQDQKDTIKTCHQIMDEHVVDPIHSSMAYFPSSPTTVMPIQKIYTFNCNTDLSLLIGPGGLNVNFINRNKRKREEGDMSNQCQ